MSIAFKGVGTGAATETSGAACSPTCPATVDANDILIAHVYFEGVVTTPSTPSGWTLLSGPHVVQTTIGQHWVYGKIAAGTEDGAAVAFGSQAVTTMRSARVYSFSGWVAGTIDQLVGSNGFDATSHATDPQMPTVTTTATGSLAIALVVQNDNNSLAAATGATGGTWAEATAEFVAALTPGLVLQLQTCTPTANPGTVSGGAVAATNDPSGVIGFQIRAKVAATGSGTPAVTLSDSAAGTATNTPDAEDPGTPNLLNETFEGAGYVVLNDSTNIGSGSTLDPDYATSNVGSPAGWGTQCLRANSVSPNWSCEKNHVPASALTGNLYFRNEFIVVSDTIADGTATYLFSAWDTGFVTNLFHIGIRRDAGVLRVFIDVNNAPPAISANYNAVISQNQKYAVEVNFNITSGTYAVRLDGVSLGSGSLTGGAANCQWIRLGANLFGTTQPVQVVHDNVGIGDNGWLGRSFSSGAPAVSQSSSAAGTAVQIFNGSGTPSYTLSSTAAGTAVQMFVGSGTPNTTLSTSATGTATQTFVGTGALSTTLAATGSGSGTNTPDAGAPTPSTGSGTPAVTLSTSAAGVAVQTFVGTGTPTKTLSVSAAGAAVQIFVGTGTPTTVLSASASGIATNDSPIVVETRRAKGGRRQRIHFVEEKEEQRDPKTQEVYIPPAPQEPIEAVGIYTPPFPEIPAPSAVKVPPRVVNLSEKRTPIADTFDDDEDAFLQILMAL